MGSVLAVFLGIGPAGAQSESSTAAEAVVATVGGEPIYGRDVERLLGKVSGGQPVNPAVLPVFQAQVLSEIVDRRLVLAYARRTGSGPARSEVGEALAGFKSKLAAQQRSLEDYLREQSISEADLRRQIEWNLAWPKYLARYLTEERLGSYFEAHRREFDGRRVSVRQILLRPAADAGPKAMDDLVERAAAIRRAITSGELSFAEAARRHSAAPSGAEGGRLGFITRRGAMGEAFSRAAFALEPGEVSDPVTTQFGVHLIQCDEITPGSKTPDDVRAPLEEALARQLITKLARLEQGFTAVKFTGAAPYFKPGTRELVVP